MSWVENDLAWTRAEQAKDDRDYRERTRWLEKLQRRVDRGEELTEFEAEQLRLG